MEKSASKFNKKFIRNYEEDHDKGYIFEADDKYVKRFYNFHSNLPFLAGRMKINSCNKLVFNLYDKKAVVHIRALKQALNHGLVLKKVHRVIKFNQKVWLKPYIDMITKLRTETKLILKNISLR